MKINLVQEIMRTLKIGRLGAQVASFVNYYLSHFLTIFIPYISKFAMDSERDG